MHNFDKPTSHLMNTRTRNRRWLLAIANTWTMRLIPLLLVLSLIAGCLVMPYPHTSQRSLELRGRVLDAETHTPIKGAKIYLVGKPQESLPEHATYTDATGTFRLRATRQFHLGVAVMDDIDYWPRSRSYVGGRISHPDYSGWRFYDALGSGGGVVDGSGVKDYEEIFLEPRIRIAVGLNFAEAVSTIKRLGGIDTTLDLRSNPKYGDTHKESYWRLDRYKAVIMIFSEDDRVTGLTYWPQGAFEDKASRANTEQSVATVKFDTTEYEVSIEKTK